MICGVVGSMVRVFKRIAMEIKVSLKKIFNAIKKYIDYIGISSYEYSRQFVLTDNQIKELEEILSQGKKNA